MAFPVHAADGVYILSDSSKVRGKQTAIDAQEKLTPGSPVPKGYKGPLCPRTGCGSANIRAIRSHEGRGIGGRGKLPRIYSCHVCGMRWQEAA